MPIVGGEDAFCSQLNRLLSEFYGAGIVHWVVFLVDVCENYLDFKEAYPDEHPREEGPIGCAEQPRDDQEAKAGSISGFGLTTDEVDDVRDSCHFWLSDFEAGTPGAGEGVEMSPEEESAAAVRARRIGADIINRVFDEQAARCIASTRPIRHEYGRPIDDFLACSCVLGGRRCTCLTRTHGLGRAAVDAGMA